MPFFSMEFDSMPATFGYSLHVNGYRINAIDPVRYLSFESRAAAYRYYWEHSKDPKHGFDVMTDTIEVKPLKHADPQS